MSRVPPITPDKNVSHSQTPCTHVYYSYYGKFELTIPTFAVITGSTDGIGKAYAREVRTQGHYNRERERESESDSYDKELDLLDLLDMISKRFSLNL